MGKKAEAKQKLNYETLCNARLLAYPMHHGRSAAVNVFRVSEVKNRPTVRLSKALSVNCTRCPCRWQKQFDGGENGSMQWIVNYAFIHVRAKLMLCVINIMFDMRPRAASAL